MSGLSAFFSQNAVKLENVKHVVSDRFLDENGEPIEWEIKPITETETESLRKECTQRVPVPGRKNLFQPEMNADKYAAKMAVKCTVYPNLHDAELQNTYNVMGAESLLKAMLTSGEYANYIEKLQEVNKYQKPLDELVEEAKN